MSLGLLGAYISSDDDDSSTDSEQNETTETKNETTKLSNPFNSSASEAKVLPRPSFMVAQKDFTEEKSKTSENSVFANPFKSKEDQKRLVLERHVKITEKQEEQRTIGKYIDILQTGFHDE